MSLRDSLRPSVFGSGFRVQRPTLGGCNAHCKLACMGNSPEQDQRKSRWQPPLDSDLISIPLVLGGIAAVLAILAAFIFIGWPGQIVLVVVLIAALGISYRVITSSDTRR